MALTSSEIQSLRFHLGYGNIGVNAYPYTPDGFYELFTQVVAPNLETAAVTSSTTAVTAGTTQAITVASPTDIVVNTSLVVDVGDEAEVVIVKAISGSTVTAAFTKAHSSGGYPVAIMSGEARLRMLLWDADQAWKSAQNSKITKTAGLKQLGQGEIEWFPNGSVLSDSLEHYKSIVMTISLLVRVEPSWAEALGRSTRLEAY